jgi:hypothetical protein
VRNNRELLDVVMETLAKIENDLVGMNSTAALLWNEVKVVGTTRWRPKPEDAISDFVAHKLRTRLSGRHVMINRGLKSLAGDTVSATVWICWSRQPTGTRPICSVWMRVTRPRRRGVGFRARRSRSWRSNTGTLPRTLSLSRLGASIEAPNLCSIEIQYTEPKRLSSRYGSDCYILRLFLQTGEDCIESNAGRKGDKHR